jgi:hypothetical protein
MLTRQALGRPTAGVSKDAAGKFCPQPKDTLREIPGCGKLVSQHGFAPILKRPQKQAGASPNKPRDLPNLIDS